jgi:hypothetical protein
VNGTNRYEYLSSFGNLNKGRKTSSAVLWKPVENAVVTTEDIMSDLSELNEDRLQQLPDEHIIFFWASRVFFNIRSTEQRYWEQTLNVVTAAGDSVGTVHKAETPQWKLGGGDHSTCCEFVAVGRRWIAELPEFPPVVLALQIVWEDSIAYRVSTAEIDEVAWLNAQPQWKLIALM